MFFEGEKKILPLKNKPAAQAADADPSRCKSTSMQKKTHLTKLPLLLNQCSNFDALQDLEYLNFLTFFLRLEAPF